MERSNEASSYSLTVTKADEASPCHHRCFDPSSADVIAQGQHCLRRPIRSCSDIQGAGPSLSNDVFQTNRISPSVEVKCWSASSNGVAACTEWSKVNRCGAGASDLTLDKSTCSAPQYMNPVTPPSDPDSDTQEGDVTSDLWNVNLDNNALNEQSPAPRHRNTFECGRRQSAPGQLGQDDGGSESELQSRRPGLAEYFSRKQRPMTQNLPGWKLFGKLPPKQSPTKQARIIQQEFEARQVCSSPTHHAAGQQNKKKVEFEPLSTTALILEDRPANLPAKSAEEAQRHRQQHEQMVAAVKRRELKEAQRRWRNKEERLKQEEVLSNTSLVWNLHILPHWDLMRSSRRAQDLWWGGLPPSVRGRVWSLAVGNELNITAELYEIFLSRAKEKWRSLSETDGAACGLEVITRDVSMTLPSLLVFHKGGPYHDLLQSILGAYTCYRPDVGYVQAMSSMAAMLILNMDEVEVFISFCNLINRPCQLAFYRVDHQRMLRYFGAFQVFFQETLPRLFLHFQFSGVTPDLYLMDWILSLYMKPLPLDVACRVWDVFFRDGEEFLFRTALGILRLYQDLLLHMDLVSIAQFLSRLPEEELLSDRLFACISATPMQSGNRKWTQMLLLGRDLEQSS